VFILSIETVLLVRKDLTAEDIGDILDFVEENEDLLEAVNKFYPLNQGTGDCAA
jgi:hypothetical protein